MAKNIALGFDGSAGSRRALEEAITLSLFEHARLYIVTVEELPCYWGAVGEVIEEHETVNKYISRLHQEACKLGEKHGLEIQTIIRVGHAAKELVNYIQEAKIDLLIIGHTGQSALWDSILGTTAEKVLRHATCSVMVVR